MTPKSIWTTFGCLGALLGLRAQEPVSTNAVPDTRPLYRYLFLVDTSSAMSRQKDVAADTVSKLIVNGAGGRFRSGDTVGIWTFDDSLHTNVFPNVMWDARLRVAAAERAFRVLREQRFKKAKGAWDATLGRLTEEAQRSGALSVFLFTDGSQPLRGTPFDQPINGIFAQHTNDMRKAKKPFVIVLLAQEGRFAAYSVSPGGEPIYIPPLPKPVVPAMAPTETTNPPSARAQAPKKSMGVAEIEAALRAPKTNASGTEAAPPGAIIMRGTNLLTGSETTNEPARPGTGNTTAADPAAAHAEKSTAANTPAANASAAPPSTPPAAPPRIPPANSPPPGGAPTGTSPGVASTSPAPETQPSAAPSPAVPAAARSKPAAVSVPEPDHDAAADTPALPETSPTPPQTAVLAQPPPSDGSWKYLAAAGGLLVLALLLAGLYFRSIRYVARPSAISRSMEKEK